MRFSPPGQRGPEAHGNPVCKPPPADERRPRPYPVPADRKPAPPGRRPANYPPCPTRTIITTIARAI